MHRRLAGSIAVAVLFCCALPDGTFLARDKPRVGTATAKKGWAMDYGPFLSSSLDRDPAVSKKHGSQSTEQEPHPNNLVTKSVNVKLLDGKAAVAFDTDLLRYGAAWTGGFLDLDKTHLTSEKGEIPLTIPQGAEVVFTTPKLPGARIFASNRDPRPKPYGPLPKDVAHYEGLYRHGDRVIFSYTVGPDSVLDVPGAVEKGGRIGFTRTLDVSGKMSILVAELPGASGTVAEPDEAGAGLGAVLECGGPAAKSGPAALAVGFAGRPPVGAKFRVLGDQVYLDLGARARLKLLICRATDRPSVESAFASLLPAAGEPEYPHRMIQGGPALWPQEIKLKGFPSRDAKKAYVTDVLSLPFDNPWNAWLRPTGIDFFSDGRLAVCTWSGDVWVASGIDDSLQNLSWKRFAAGLYEPLGLKIVDDVIYTTCRDQITRLHDLNADGEADFYENFNNDAVAIANYHGFAFDLATDPAGNFYYTRVGHRADPSLPHHGVLLRVSKDGQKLETIATGFRAANGLSVGPRGQITVADNQGNWTPTSRINLVRPGGFYGYMPHVTAAGLFPARTDHDPPLCWVPYSADNSSGSQIWATTDRWGPLSGQLLHTSYGKASLFLVLQDAGPAGHLADPQSGTPQGGTVRLPLSFDSGITRGAVNPRDGQVYVAGLKGWQTAGALDGTVARVRHTGKPLHLPVGLKVLPTGLELTFSDPLDRETAEDVESYGIEQWNYRWTKDYGSPDFSLARPDRQGRDEVPLKSATLRPDGRTVHLAIPTLQPVMQMQIHLNLDTADGATIDTPVWLTINRVPAAGR